MKTSALYLKFFRGKPTPSEKKPCEPFIYCQ